MAFDREPCPDRILDDVGGAFSMGAIGGAAWHFLRGIRHSPQGSRLVGATQGVRMNAPRIAGSFAVWGGLFSVTDCALVYLRQKEDPWNSIMAGALTSGILQLRQGLGAAARSAVGGGVLLALIEGSSILLNKVGTLKAQGQILVDSLDPNIMNIPMGMGGPSGMQIPVTSNSQEASSSSSGSWFGGGWLGSGGKKAEENKSSGGAKEVVLESYDTPLPPTFEFK